MSNYPTDFRELFHRDLARLRTGIDTYETEDALWVKGGIINNSAGNLALHICGNLQHFVGAVLYNTSYVRDRDF